VSNFISFAACIYELAPEENRVLNHSPSLFESLRAEAQALRHCITQWRFYRTAVVRVGPTFHALKYTGICDNVNLTVPYYWLSTLNYTAALWPNRPISNLHTISKMLERLFMARIRSHVERCANFNRYQVVLQAWSLYRHHAFDNVGRRLSCYRQSSERLCCCSFACQQHTIHSTKRLS